MNYSSCYRRCPHICNYVTRNASYRTSKNGRSDGSSGSRSLTANLSFSRSSTTNTYGSKLIPDPVVGYFTLYFTDISCLIYKCVTSKCLVISFDSYNCTLVRILYSQCYKAIVCLQLQVIILLTLKWLYFRLWMKMVRMSHLKIFYLKAKKWLKKGEWKS